MMKCHQQGGERHLAGGHKAQGTAAAAAAMQAKTTKKSLSEVLGPKMRGGILCQQGVFLWPITAFETEAE